MKRSFIHQFAWTGLKKWLDINFVSIGVAFIVAVMLMGFGGAFALASNGQPGILYTGVGIVAAEVLLAAGAYVRIAGSYKRYCCLQTHDAFVAALQVFAKKLAVPNMAKEQARRLLEACTHCLRVEPLGILQETLENLSHAYPVLQQSKVQLALGSEQGGRLAVLVLYYTFNGEPQKITVDLGRYF